MAFGATNIIGELGIKVTGYTKDLSSSLDQATKEIKSFGRSTEVVSKASRLAFVGIAAGATALASGLAISAKKAVDFEKQMANVSTLIDTNVESMDEMGKAVLAVAKRTPVELNDLTSALYDIRSAGISASDAMEVLEGSAQLGVAGLGSTSEAVDLVTSSINAFKLEGEEAAQVYGYVFNTVKSGKTTISELAQGFGAVAGTVANANIELPEYLSAVAALTTTGLPAAQAHTQLKAAIAGVTRDSKELRVVLDKLGSTSFKDLVKQQGGMVNAFKAITKEVEGNDAAILKLFGSTEAYNAVIQLSGDLNETFIETLESMEHGVDNLSDAFEKQSATVSAEWQVLKNNFNALSIQIGSALLPALNKALGALVSFIDKIPEIVQQFKDFVANNDVVQGALVALGSILTGLAISVIPSLVVSLGSLIATVAVAAAPFVAIGAVITAIYVAFKNWDQIVGIVQGVWSRVVGYTTQVWEFLKPYIATAVRAVAAVLTGGLSEIVILFVNNWDKIKQGVISFWEWIKPYIATAIRAVLAIMTGGLSEIVIAVVKNWDDIKKKTTDAWNAIKAVTIAIWNAIVSFLVGIWESIKGIFTSGLSAVNKAWTTTWNGIKDFASSSWTFIKETVSSGIEAVKGIFDGGVSILGNAWTAVWDNLKGIVKGAFEKIKGTVSGIISAVASAISRINALRRARSSAGGFARGGFTHGSVNKIAGVVHGGEWVAPAWMVDKYANLISQMEGIRMRGYVAGGFVRDTVNYNNQRTVNQNITQNIRDGVDFTIAARELAWQARFS